jgi:hypothetical protein
MLGHGFHPARDPEITDAKLTQGIVKTGEEEIDKLSGQLFALGTAGCKRLKNQEGVHRQEVEAAIDSVGHAEMPVKDKRTRARHHRVMEAPRGVG